MKDKLSICDGIKLMITIVDRGKGERITDFCKEINVNFHLICFGSGTANSEILEYIGLDETEKDVILSVVPEERAHSILTELSMEMEFDKQGNGISFTVPISSVGGIVTLQLLTGLI